MTRRHPAAREISGIVTRLLGAPLPVGIEAWDGSRAGPDEGPRVVLRSRRALRRLLWNPGELGLARAYVSGDLDVRGDLADGLRRAWASGPAAPVRLRPADRAAALRTAVTLGALGPRPRPPAQEARVRGRLHSRLRDRSVISHHYDHGNDFYELVLEEQMAYSCGYWTSEQDSHADAQWRKLELICRKLGLAEGMRLLDVGCGWGALLLHAARYHGVRGVGITLSQEQAEFVRDRAKRLGVDDRVDVRLTDYRELTAADAGGLFDAVSSIEMGEHVGEERYPEYTRIMAGMLKPTGRLLLQQMSRGAVAPGGGAFIESYIAPDMTMRPLSATLAHLEAAGFEVADVHGLREHYVRTIDAWREQLLLRWDDVVAVSGEAHARVWNLYLAGASLAFAQHRMGVDQILAVRPDADGRSGLPPAREA